jgi:hypothetical protein
LECQVEWLNTKILIITKRIIITNKFRVTLFDTIVNRVFSVCRPDRGIF